MFDELKGFDKIDDIINDFCNKFDCSAELGDEFCYWDSDNTINYNLVIGCLSDEVWKEYVLDTFGYTIQNIFVFSLLHEIGHHYTLNNYTKTKRNKEEKAVAKIEDSLKYAITEEEDRVLYREYFNLEMEKVATEWAVNYARKHKTELHYFWKKLERALKSFYKMNLDAEEFQEEEYLGRAV